MSGSELIVVRLLWPEATMHEVGAGPIGTGPQVPQGGDCSDLI